MGCSWVPQTLYTFEGGHFLQPLEKQVLGSSSLLLPSWTCSSAAVNAVWGPLCLNLQPLLYRSSPPSVANAGSWMPSWSFWFFSPPQTWWTPPHLSGLYSSSAGYCLNHPRTRYMHVQATDWGYQQARRDGKLVPSHRCKSEWNLSKNICRS